MNKFKQMRVERGLSMMDVQAGTGIYTSSLCRYEDGSRFPSVSSMKALTDFYGVPFDYFMDGDGGTPTDTAPELPAGAIKVVPTPSGEIETAVLELMSQMDIFEKVNVLQYVKSIVDKKEDNV